MTARETTEPGVATHHNGEADRRSLDVSRFGGGRVVGQAARRAAGLGAPARPAARRGADPARGPRAAGAGRADPSALPASTGDDELHAVLDGRRRRHRGRAGSRLHRLLPAGQHHRAAAPLAGDRRRPRRARWRPPPAGSARPWRRAPSTGELVSRGARPAGVPAGLHRPPDRGQPSLGAGAAAQDRRRRGRPGGPAPSPGRDRRSASAASPSWSTCSGRPTSCGSCGPSRRTRPGPRPTTCSRSPSQVVPDLLEELDRALAPSGSSCRPTPGRCGSAAGPAATATATRTSRPPVTLDVLGPAARLRSADADRRGRGPAHRDERLDPGRRGHRRAAGQPRRATPRRCRSRTRRGPRLNAEEPYRLKLTLRPGPAAAHPRPAGRRHAARARPGLPRPRRAARRPDPDPRLDAGRRRPADRRRRASCG